MKHLSFQGKYLIRNQDGQSSIGAVLFIFMILIFVIIPIFQMSYEIVHLNAYKQRLITASELAAYDLLLSLDSSSISEKTFVFEMEVSNHYQNKLADKLLQNGLKDDFLKLEVTYIHPKKISIRYDYPYEPIFNKRSIEKAFIEVAFIYSYPIND